MFEATGQALSGHSLKHLLAAGAAWPVLAALYRLRADGGHGAAAASVQNGAHAVGAARQAGT